MKQKENLKGQYFSFDAIIASVIFILALVSLLSYWQSLRTALNSQTNDIAKEALRISDLFLTPGYPADMACNKMDRLGFSVSWQDRRINNTKLACAKILDETTLKTKFSTPYNITVIEQDGALTKLAFGTDMTGLNFKQVAKVRRVVSIVDEKGVEKVAALDVFVYQ